MPFGLDLLHPWLLLLLPLALLPLRRRQGDTLTIGSVAWLPADPVGRVLGLLWRVFAALTVVATVIGLAGPGRGGGTVLRTGRGAEVLVLMDRSSSMDANVIQKDVKAGGQFDTGRPSKSTITRDLLSRFVAKRPNDRFAFMLFSTSPMLAVPFTRNGDVIQSALSAAGIGRGLPDTLMGPGLLAAIGEFEGRPYAGSRIVIVVSDGGAQLDAATQERIRTGLAREKIGLYWIYIRSSSNSPDLTKDAATGTYDSVEELALHTFFRTLSTPYRLFQTDDSEAMAAAMTEIDRQQNFPISFHDRVPRVDFAPACFVVALICCLGLLLARAVQLPDWQSARPRPFRRNGPHVAARPASRGAIDGVGRPGPIDLQTRTR